MKKPSGRNSRTEAPNSRTNNSRQSKPRKASNFGRPPRKEFEVDRPQRRFQEDRFEGDRPFYNRDDRRDGGRPPFNREDRPQRRSDDRPFRREDGGDRDRAPRYNRDDRRDNGRPPFNREDRPQRRSDDRPFRREEGGDRDRAPRYNRDSGRPPFNRENRPQRRSDDRPFRREEGGDRDRAPRYNRDDRRDGGRPPFSREDRPQRRSDDRPFRREDGGDRDSAPRYNRDDRRDGGRPPFNREDRREGGRPPFNREDRPQRRSDDRPFRGDRDNRGRKPQGKGGPRKPFYEKFTGNDQPQGDYVPSRMAKARGYKVQEDEYEERPRRRWKEELEEVDMPGPVTGVIRLNRYIALSGVCSRRQADELILEGKVKVNGEVATELGMKVDTDKDVILLNGKAIQPRKFVYILLNKPKNHLSTVSDPEGRRTVMDLISDATSERVYPVGRLDRNTTGLLLLTNDGDLAKKLTHPSHNVRKVYAVRLDKPVKQDDMQKLLEGIELEDGPANVDRIDYIEGADANEVGVEIHSGRNRIVRRMFEHLGYEVTALDRVAFGSLTKKGLKRGFWRLLEEREVGYLKML